MSDAQNDFLVAERDDLVRRYRRLLHAARMVSDTHYASVALLDARIDLDDVEALMRALGWRDLGALHGKLAGVWKCRDHERRCFDYVNMVPLRAHGTRNTIEYARLLRRALTNLGECCGGGLAYAIATVLPARGTWEHETTDPGSDKERP